jgi:hypothetical protein
MMRHYAKRKGFGGTEKPKKGNFATSVRDASGGDVPRTREVPKVPFASTKKKK